MISIILYPQTKVLREKKKTWEEDETDKELREDLILKYLQLYT